MLSITPDMSRSHHDAAPSVGVHHFGRDRRFTGCIRFATLSISNFLEADICTTVQDDDRKKLPAFGDP